MKMQFDSQTAAIVWLVSLGAIAAGAFFLNPWPGIIFAAIAAVYAAVYNLQLEVHALRRDIDAFEFEIPARSRPTTPKEKSPR